LPRRREVGAHDSVLPAFSTEFDRLNKPILNPRMPEAVLRASHAPKHVLRNADSIAYLGYFFVDSALYMGSLSWVLQLSHLASGIIVPIASFCP
jgi:hypothetical protein